MIEVSKNLLIGADSTCTFSEVEGMAIIHACKHPCHTKALGYKGSLPQNHPNYLILEHGNHLVLNMVDMEREFHPTFTNPIMQTAMAFIEKHIADRKVLVHCNQGQSRSPSIVLLFLARRKDIPHGSFMSAAQAFRDLYPKYQPGTGISKYLARHWDFLMQMDI